MNGKAAELSKDLEYRYLMTSLNASISKHLLDEHFTLVAANNRYYELFGYTKSEYEALYANRPDLFFKDSPDEWNQLNTYVIDAIQSGKNRYDCIMRMKHRNGQKLWIRLIGIFIDEYVEGVQISYSIMMDISDSMQTKIERDAVQDNMPGLVSKYRVTNEGYEFLDGNRNFLNTFQSSRSYRKDDLHLQDGLEAIATLYPDFRKGIQHVFTIAPLDKQGKKTYFSVHAQCIDWIEEDPVFLLIYTDITEITLQKQQLEEYNTMLHKLAFSDELTGGYNRRKFELDAGVKIVNAPPGTYNMLWMNLQKFKVVNEVGGAEAGDRALSYIHHQILKHLRADEYVSRLYSDNFVILMHNEGDACTETRMNEIVKDINSYNLHSNFKFYLNFHIGIYHIEDTGVPITYCEDRAHAARKAAAFKNSGFCVFRYYDEKLRREMLNEKNLENRMQDALKNGEFKIYLQPKYSIEKGSITGAEALIRWDDPKEGILPPSEFIPYFEANGFIVQIDLFVFETVCKLIRTWLDEGHSMIKISVNMSRRHFMNVDFMKPYVEICDRYQVPKQYLEIELTETMVFENPETFKEIVHEIHKAGFNCSLDDFGSGYSTLSALKDLDIDTLKLDKSFFSSEAMDNAKENIIIKSVLEMSQALDIETVAEGIETFRQKDFLCNTTCNLIQGYVISRPLPVSAFYDFVFKNQ